MWHQGNMPSFKLAPACMESLVGSSAAVGSMNNDGRLELSEESRLWTLAGDLGRKGKKQETMGRKCVIPLVLPSMSSASSQQ